MSIAPVVKQWLFQNSLCPEPRAVPCQENASAWEAQEYPGKTRESGAFTAAKDSFVATTPSSLTQTHPELAKNPLGSSLEQQSCHPPLLPSFFPCRSRAPEILFQENLERARGEFVLKAEFLFEKVNFCLKR